MIPDKSIPSPMMKISQSDDDKNLEDVDSDDFDTPSVTPLQVLGSYCETITINICNLIKSFAIY